MTQKSSYFAHRFTKMICICYSNEQVLKVHNTACSAGFVLRQIKYKKLQKCEFLYFSDTQIEYSRAQAPCHRFLYQGYLDTEHSILQGHVFEQLAQIQILQKCEFLYLSPSGPNPQRVLAAAGKGLRRKH